MNQREILPLYPGWEMTYKTGNRSNVSNSINIHFFAEGFKDMPTFMKVVETIFNELLNISPFNLLKDGTGIFSAYYYWPVDENIEPILPPNSGQNLGPLLSTTQPSNRTFFNSYFYETPDYPSGTRYTVDLDKEAFYNSIVNVQNRRNGNEYVSLIENLKVKENEIWEETNSIAFLLYPYLYAPSIAVDGIDYIHNGIKFYFVPDQKEIASRFLARVIAEHLGLYTESNFSDPQNISPVPGTELIKILLAPNLVYFDNLSGTTYHPDDLFKWNNYIDKSLNDSGLTIHNTPSGNDKNQVRSQEIGLWKGGGGYID